MVQEPFIPRVPRQAKPSHPVPELLARIQAHPLDKPGAEFQFSERLALENGWPRSFALRVIQEYRRFVYLACLGEGEVTPSDEVDQAWHLYLAYTRDYWEEFCPKVLGRPLHHAPADGGGDEEERYEANYGRTLELYGRIFGTQPPSDIWPPAAIRFRYAPANVRVNKLLFRVVPKRKPKGRWIGWLGVVTFAAIVTALIVNVWSSLKPASGTADVIFFSAFCLTAAYFLLRATAAIAPGLRRVLGGKRGEKVITQPQHGYTVAFTVGVVIGAGVAEAAVTGVDISGDGSGEGGSGGGDGGGGGHGGGGGSGCGGGGCGGGS